MPPKFAWYVVEVTNTRFSAFVGDDDGNEEGCDEIDGAELGALEGH